MAEGSPPSSIPPSSPSHLTATPDSRIKFGSPAAPRARPPTVAQAASVLEEGGTVLFAGSVLGFHWRWLCLGLINQAISLPESAFDLSCLGPAAGSRWPVCF